MEIILIVLTGVLFGTLLVTAYALGFQRGSKKDIKEGVDLTEQNAQFVKDMLAWKNYGGKL